MMATGIVTICLVHAETNTLFHARNPFAAGGVYEDAATGAAAAALAERLAKYTSEAEPILERFAESGLVVEVRSNPMPDGGTVLLGGLKTASEGRNEFGPPILSKIPYLSRLFKNVGYGREATSLLMMVTPRIIINEEEELIYLEQLPPIPRP